MKQLLLFLLLFTTALASFGSGTPGSDGPGPFPLDISVYPNPSNGTFNVSVWGVNEDGAHIVISNLIGQTVAEYKSDVDFRTSFDLSHMPKGVYFLTVNCGDKQTMKRLVFQ